MTLVSLRQFFLLFCFMSYEIIIIRLSLYTRLNKVLISIIPKIWKYPQQWPPLKPPDPPPPKKQRNKKIEFFRGLYYLVVLFLLLYCPSVPTGRNQYFFVLQGIMAHVYETFVVLILLAVLVTSILWVGYNFLFCDLNLTKYLLNSSEHACLWKIEDLRKYHKLS